MCTDNNARHFDIANFGGEAVDFVSGDEICINELKFGRSVSSFGFFQDLMHIDSD